MKQSPLALAVCVSLPLFGAPAAGQAGVPGPRVPVRISGGLVSGVPTASGMVYKGIAYAAPPVGGLRWHSPEPPPAWSDVKVADTFGPPCAQAPLRGLTQLSAISREDCLYLNVWVPRAAQRAKLPVMVWIHGGGFVNGAGSSPTYDGTSLAARGVILVTINYRLGPFGFFAHPALSADSAHRSSGNFGLEDQVAALRWVAVNIAGFGGNPSNITIFGQSAGGASVVDLMASPLTRGLFQRAIIESGAARGAIAPATQSDGEQQGSAFADGRTTSELRSLGADAVLQRYQEFTRAGGRLGPVIDGYVLARPPLITLTDRTLQPVALLIGSNSREGLETVEASRLEAVIRKEFGANAEAALRFYGLSNGTAGPTDPLLGTAAQQFSTDSTFRCGSVQVAEARARAGAPTWQYQFEQIVPGREQLGAAQSFEVPYVLGTLSPTGFSAANYAVGDRRLSDLMTSYWTNFAKRGDPNGPGLPRWPRYLASSRSYARLSSALPQSMQVAADLRGTLCRLFPKSAPTKR